MPGEDPAQDDQHAAELQRRYPVAVMLIGLVRGLPGRAETEAAEGSALPG